MLGKLLLTSNERIVRFHDFKKVIKTERSGFAAPPISRGKLSGKHQICLKTFVRLTLAEA